MRKLYLLLLLVLFGVYLNFLYQDFAFNAETAVLKYSTVFIILIMTLLFYRQSVNYQNYLIGLLFIISADYFLLFHHNETEIMAGIFLFLLAHLFYQRLYNKNDRFFCAFIIIIAAILILPVSELLFRLGFVYAMALLMNLALSFSLFIKHKNYSYLLAALAFILLILCDIYILYSFFVGNLYQWIWLFYVPFLVLLNVSVLKPFEKKSLFQLAR